jgi:surfeit locus 1 family protein
MRLNRRSLGLLIVSVVAALALARLGLWQLGRASQKEALQAAIQSQSSLPVLGNGDLATDFSATELLHRQVMLRGQWQPGATVYLDNRPMAGRVGFIVVTPLKLEGRADAIAVQRGWAPRDAQDRTRLVPVLTPSEPIEIEGRLAPSPSALLELSPTHPSPGLIRQNLDLSAYSVEAGMRLLPLTVLQHGAAQDGLLRDWPAPAVNVQKHYGYAFQWFAMSALVVGLYVWFQLIRPQRVQQS